MISALTTREKQIAMMLAAGRTSKEAAFELGISPRTAEAHRQQVLSKLGLKSAVELAHVMIATGQLSPQLFGVMKQTQCHG
jgi:DNA-binding NarL/FixJ family response regulator